MGRVLRDEPDSHRVINRDMGGPEPGMVWSVSCVGVGRVSGDPETWVTRDVGRTKVRKKVGFRINFSE